MKRNHLILLSIFFLLGTGSLYGQEADNRNIPELASIEVLDLATAQRIAIAENPSMEAAMARVEQAQARVEQAVAAWWPSLDLTARGARTRLPDSYFESSSVFAGAGGSSFGFSLDQTSEEYIAGLQASWILFNGFYRKFNQERAKYAEYSVTESRDNVKRLLLTSVAEAFFNAQSAQTQVDIAQADSEFYSQQLRDAQNRYEVGAGPWGDVLNIKVQLNSARTSLLLSRREHEAALYGLAALMGQPDAELPGNVRLPDLDMEIADGFAQKTEQLIQEAQAARPDIRALELQVKSAEAGVGAARANYYPTFQLVGSVDGYRQDDPGFTGDDFGNTIALNLSWNLFSGGLDRARQFEAQQFVRETEFSLSDLRNQVASEVRQGVVLLQAAREQVELQQESVKLVEENRDLARSEYEAGEASLVRLNEAQRDLTRTYSRLAQAVVSYYRARQRLLSATGRILAEVGKNDG